MFRIHQVGDALVSVNHERLTLLNHENVVRVLRGLLNTTGSQILLLRFAYSEDSARLLPPPPPPPPFPPKTPKPVRHSSLGNPQSEPHLPLRGGSGGGAVAVKGAEEEAFRSESWHGSRRPQGSSIGAPGGVEGGLGRSASASPPHASGLARVRSHSLGEDSPKPLQKGVGSVGSVGEEGGKIMAGEGAGGKGLGGWAVSVSGGVDRNVAMSMANGRRRGELWGERETGLAGGGGGGDGGGRHVYLGDMGNAGAQMTLQSIAKDVQVFAASGLFVWRQYCIRQTALKSLVHLC